jgi:hypothetical protein
MPPVCAGHTGGMAKLMSRIVAFVRSPQGQRLVRQAQQQAAKPENRRKLDQLRQRMLKKR